MSKIKLNLPDYNLKTQFSEDGQEEVFDVFRKIWVILTPEEWVRQNFLHYLLNEKGYPRSLIKVEHKINAFKKHKRCDAIFYNQNIQPIALLECKAPAVKINKNTFDQIGLYNSILKAPYLFLTNGLEHFSCRFEFSEKKMKFLDSIPAFQAIKDESISDYN